LTLPGDWSHHSRSGVLVRDNADHRIVEKPSRRAVGARESVAASGLLDAGSGAKRQTGIIVSRQPCRRGFTMQGITKFGAYRSLGAMAVLALVLGLCASTSGRSIGRNLSRQEMLTSFGGVPPVILCCGFNSGCYFPNTQTVGTCGALTNLGQSFCTAITVYSNNNNQRCTPDPSATQGACNQAPPGQLVVCSQCSVCTWVPGVGGGGNCVYSSSCGAAWNTSFCNDTCQ
jgi:hypothetical protein